MESASEIIQKHRGVALDILKPSDSQLEHGLELHGDSLVFESYGFAPLQAIDGDAVRAAVEEGATAREIEDMIEIMRKCRCVTDAEEREEYKAAWDAAGVTCVFQNAGQEGQDPARLLKRHATFTYVTDMLSDFVVKAATPDDIVAAGEQGKHCLYFMANGVPLAQRWESVEEELAHITFWFQLGCRMMHLTYNRSNMIGDGCIEPANGGLSDFGRAVVAEMNRVGVIVDVAHSSWQTCLDAAGASERPMVASHTACRALGDHPRCKPDNVIKAIVDTGGVVGICSVPAFLGGDGDISTMLNHIDYVVKKFGADHVSIGTDVAYQSSRSRQENAKVPKRPKRRKPWRSFWQPNDELHAPQWHTERQIGSMAWTNWPLFTVGLVQRGYSDVDIRKIIGGNILRVARAAMA